MAHTMQFLLPTTLALTLAIAPSPAGASRPTTIEDHEWAMVPNWCRDAGAGFSVTSNPELYQSGLAKVKDPSVRAKIMSLDRSGCGGYHHYCYALLWSNRANLDLIQKEDSQIAGLLADALGDFGFVLNASKPGCALLPDIYTKIGEIQMQVDKPGEAEANFKKALEIAHGYPQAFMGLSDLFESQGQTDKSIAVLHEGLKVNPQSNALKKKLARIEGRAAASGNAP